MTLLDGHPLLLFVLVTAKATKLSSHNSRSNPSLHSFACFGLLWLGNHEIDSQDEPITTMYKLSSYKNANEQRQMIILLSSGETTTSNLPSPS